MVKRTKRYVLVADDTQCGGDVYYLSGSGKWIRAKGVAKLFTTKVGANRELRTWRNQFLRDTLRVEEA